MPSYKTKIIFRLIKKIDYDMIMTVWVIYMEDIKFNNEKDIDSFFRHLKILGSGTEGTVHRKGIYTYKRYNDLYRNLYRK